ncbi:MAG: CoA-binding protein [Bacteroidetes bacterium]|nr:CoA-binding protein [Bacteroidota bacterium]
MKRTDTREPINTFFSSSAYAVIGVSANRRKFGNVVYRTMKEKDFNVFPVHPTLDVVEGDACWHSVLDLPGEVKSVITVVPPDQTEKVTQECMEKGISAIWMQPGSSSGAAIGNAEGHGITVIHGNCLLMFLEPVTSFHALHRWISKLVGAYPR